MFGIGLFEFCTVHLIGDSAEFRYLTDEKVEGNYAHHRCIRNINGSERILNMDYEKFKDYFNRKSNFSRSNGITVVKIDRGYAEVETTIEESSLNNMGSLHGGVFYTLADTAAGAASMSYGITSVTLDASVTYIKPGICGKIKAIAKEVSRGRKIGVYDVSIRDEKEQLLAKCRFTMYIVGKKIEI